MCAAFSLCTTQALPYSLEQRRAHTHHLPKIWEGRIFLWGNETFTPGMTPDTELFMGLWIIIILLDFCLLGQKVPSLTWKAQASKYPIFVIFV